MSLLDTASLIVTPNGTKAGTLYSVIPNTTLGDMDVVRATDASYRGSNGLIQYASPNVPRLDYSNGTCPSILVEPQRTNLFTWSEDFTNASWLNTRATITGNQTTAPDGNNTADLIADSTYTNSNNYVEKVVFSGTISLAFSVYVKKNTADYISFGYYDNDFHGYVVNTNTWTTTHTFGSPVSFKAENAGNGWYKLTMTKTSATSGVYASVAIQGTSNGANYNGTGALSAYFWGAQLEAGSYATSYIPTTSASVTRNADVISKTGISSLIGQTEGTIFFDGILNNCEKSYANILNGERNNNASFSIIYVKSTNSLQAFILSNGFGVATIQAGYFLPGQRVKIAYSYKSGSSVLYLNGVQVGTSAQTFTLPSTIDDLYINDSVTYSGYQESVSNYTTALWKTKLTAVQLAQLTTI